MYRCHSPADMHKNTHEPCRSAGTARIAFAEVDERRGLRIADTVRKNPLACLPGRAVIVRPNQRLVDIRPWSALRVEPTEQSSPTASSPPTLPFCRIRRRILRILSAVDVESGELLRRSFDPRKAQCDTAIVIGAAEAAAIAPGGVNLVVARPSDRPQIAPRRRGAERVPIPGMPAKLSLGGYGGAVAGSSAQIMAGEHTTCSNKASRILAETSKQILALNSCFEVHGIVKTPARIFSIERHRKSDSILKRGLLDIIDLISCQSQFRAPPKPRRSMGKALCNCQEPTRRCHGRHRVEGSVKLKVGRGGAGH